PYLFAMFRIDAEPMPIVISGKSQLDTRQRRIGGPTDIIQIRQTGVQVEAYAPQNPRLFGDHQAVTGQQHQMITGQLPVRTQAVSQHDDLVVIAETPPQTRHMSAQCDGGQTRFGSGCQQ
ncbi:MAG: hypothetical protein ACRD0P_29015, partial [Stackebrandtia sp.]